MNELVAVLLAAELIDVFAYGAYSIFFAKTENENYVISMLFCMCLLVITLWLAYLFSFVVVIVASAIMHVIAACTWAGSLGYLIAEYYHHR